MSMPRWGGWIDDEDEDEDEDADLSDCWIDVEDEVEEEDCDELGDDIFDWSPDDEDWDDFANSIKDDNINLVDMSGWCADWQKLLDERDARIEHLEEENSRIHAENARLHADNQHLRNSPLYAEALAKGICVPLENFIGEIIGSHESTIELADELRLEIEHHHIKHPTDRSHRWKTGWWLKQLILGRHKWKQEQV